MRYLGTYDVYLRPLFVVYLRPDAAGPDVGLDDEEPDKHDEGLD